MKHLKTILSVLALMLAVSCTKSHVEGNGHVSFALSSDLEIADQTRSSVSQYTALPASGDFILTLTDASAAVVWTGKLSEWDSATLLPAGNYEVSATYGALETEGFDKPYFAGSASFTIVDEQTTQVSVNARLANTVILVSCTDSFKNYYKNYNFNLVRNGQTIVSFAKDETRAAFIDGYRISIEGTVTGPSKTQSFTKDYSNLKTATAYTIVFDASNVGGSSITVSFNNNVETIDLGDIELND